LSAVASLAFTSEQEGARRIAVGYHSPGAYDTGTVLTGPFVSTGWFVFAPGECSTIDNPFSARYMYWTGYRHGAYLIQDGGDSHFCMPSVRGTPPRFTFERQNESEDACVSSTPADSSGPNEWTATREVDVAVDADAEYDAN
jgi:hypothetical protein